MIKKNVSEAYAVKMRRNFKLFENRVINFILSATGTYQTRVKKYNVLKQYLKREENLSGHRIIFVIKRNMWC